MVNARFLLAALVLAGAALAACSGNFGAGTTQPGQIIPSGPLNPSSPTPTPNSASGIVTYGETDALQQIPSIGGYGGALAFPVPAVKPSGFDNVAVGVTMALVAPTDAPDLNLQVGGKHLKHRDRPARPLVYVSLLATRDITLATYPRFALDVPRDVVTTYHEEELGLAFYNSAEKSTSYRLAVAAQEATAPPAPGPSASVATGSASPSRASSVPTTSPAASPSPSPTASASPFPPGRSPTPPRNASPLPSPTLPPQRITFAAAAGTLKLTANKPAVFALYALPLPSASASPSAPTGPNVPAVPSATPARPS